jgi:hypothetical protein
MYVVFWERVVEVEGTKKLISNHKDDVSHVWRSLDHYAMIWTSESKHRHILPPWAQSISGMKLWSESSGKVKNWGSLHILMCFKSSEAWKLGKAKRPLRDCRASQIWARISTPSEHEVQIKWVQSYTKFWGNHGMLPCWNCGTKRGGVSLKAYVFQVCLFYNDVTLHRNV